MSLVNVSRNYSSLPVTLSHASGLPLERCMLFRTFEAHALTTGQLISHKHEPAIAHTPTAKTRLKGLGLAGLMFASAVLLRRIPPRVSGYQLIPTDWKQWAKIALGVMGLNQLNEALGLKLPVWLGTMQTVAILNPLLQGWKQNNLRQLLIMAPLISGLVTATRWSSERAEGFLRDKLGLPEPITRIVFSAVSVLLGLNMLPALIQPATGLAGTGNASTVRSTAMTAEALVCARGCCSSVVCMSEIGEYAAALGTWLQGKAPHSEGR